MIDLYSAFAANLKSLRKKAGFTQKSLAEYIGYTEKAISKWESANALPPVETLHALSQLFGVSIDSMLENYEEPLYYVGIDGGGTKTLLALSDADGKVLRTVTLGPCNPMIIGFEASEKIIGEGLNKLCADLSPRRISVFAGIAGIDPRVNGDVLRKYISSMNYGSVRIGNDSENVVSAGLGENDGIAVIMGTGSNLFTKRGSVLRQYGGYGYLFDNGGNGYSFARDAIAAVLAYENGYGPYTVLSEIFEKENGCKMSAMIPELYGRGNRYIASFAGLVDIAYKMNDSVAVNIFDRNMREVANIMNAALKDFDTGPVNAFFVGGLTKQSDLLFPLIQKYLDTDKEVNLIVYRHEPVLGALRLAGSPVDTSVGNGIERNVEV